MSQADRIATLEYRVAELEAMLARVTRERDILIRRYENPNPAVHQPAPLQQPQHQHRPPQQEFEHEQHSRDKATSGIRLLNARPVPAPALNGRVALPHNHHDPTASVHVQSTAGEEKTLNDLVIRQYSNAFFFKSDCNFQVSELVAANRPDEAINMLQVGTFTFLLLHPQPTSYGHRNLCVSSRANQGMTCLRKFTRCWRS
jgi:hypothetical protein